MKKFLLFTMLLFPIESMAQEKAKPDSTMIIRISEIEVYPEYLTEYLEFAHNVGATSVKEEPGVICIYPMQQLRNDCQIRILEIYASQEAYQQASDKAKGRGKLMIAHLGPIGGERSIISGHKLALGL